MTVLTIAEARANLPALTEEALQNDEPVVITSEKGNAVLLSEKCWNGVKETLSLLSVSGMRESIREGFEADPADLSKTLDW